MKTIYMRETSPQYIRYRHAITAAGGCLCCAENPLAADALLLPGGGDVDPLLYGQENQGSCPPDPERDRAEIALLDCFLAAGKPVLGICRGMQFINVYFGGTLLQDIPGHKDSSGADLMHPVRSAGLPHIFPAVCTVNSAHHQAVDCLGSGLSPLQWAPDGIVEALHHASLPLLAVQWHPERLPLPHGQQLISYFLSHYL